MLIYFLQGATLGLSASATPGPFQTFFWKAVLMNALSPNPYIFWGILAGPIVLVAWQQSPILGFSFGLGFYGTLIGGNAAIIILFDTARQLGPKVNRVLIGLSIVALLVFGLYQLWTGLSNLIG